MAYNCILCNGVFNDGEDLLFHISVVHFDLKPFRCQKCDFRSESRKLMTNHFIMDRHGDPSQPIEPVEICPTVQDSINQLVNQCKSKSSAGVRELNGLLTPPIGSTKRSINATNPALQTVGIVPLSMTNSSGTNGSSVQPNLSKRPVLPRPEVPKCGQQFGDSQGQQGHSSVSDERKSGLELEQIPLRKKSEESVATQSGSKPPETAATTVGPFGGFKCHQCGERFPRSQFRNGIAYGIRCQKCAADYAQSQKLSQPQLKRSTKIVSLYKCIPCRKAFGYEVHLRQHMQFAHGNSTESTAASLPVMPESQENPKLPTVANKTIRIVARSMANTPEAVGSSAGPLMQPNLSELPVLLRSEYSKRGDSQSQKDHSSVSDVRKSRESGETARTTEAAVNATNSVASLAVVPESLETPNVPTVDITADNSFAYEPESWEIPQLPRVVNGPFRILLLSMANTTGKTQRLATAACRHCGRQFSCAYKRGSRSLVHVCLGRNSKKPSGKPKSNQLRAAQTASTTTTVTAQTASTTTVTAQTASTTTVTAQTASTTTVTAQTASTTTVTAQTASTTTVTAQTASTTTVTAQTASTTAVVSQNRCRQAVNTDGPRAHKELKRSRLVDRKFICRHCRKAFVVKGGLNQHLIVHGIIASGSQQRPLTASEYVKCHRCPKSFVHKYRLKQHMAKHDNKKYTCDTCGMQYKQRGNLTTHKRVAHSD